MQVDRVLYPITALGPGKRVVIWTIGCTKQCLNCANPELWSSDVTRDISSARLASLLNSIAAHNLVDGITITGGDPLEQPHELLELLKMCRPLCNDILLYTGFYLEQLQSQEEEVYREILSYIDVLIDGPYIEAQNDNLCTLRGSTNQRLWFFNETLREVYATYGAAGRVVQNVFYKDKLISVGIHNRKE